MLKSRFSWPPFVSITALNALRICDSGNERVPGYFCYVHLIHLSVRLFPYLAVVCSLTCLFFVHLCVRFLHFFVCLIWHFCLLLFLRFSFRLFFSFWPDVAVACPLFLSPRVPVFSFSPSAALPYVKREISRRWIKATNPEPPGDLAWISAALQSVPRLLVTLFGTNKEPGDQLKSGWNSGYWRRSCAASG